MSKKKIVRERINNISTIATKTIPAIVNAETVDCQAYNDARLDLNNNLIQVLIGGDFVQAKKGQEEYNIKFCHALPNCQELAEILQIMDVFTKTVEIPFMEELTADDDANDMDIPPKKINLSYAFAGSGISKIENITSKNLKNYIFGYDGKNALREIMLSSIDCIQIAAMGEDLRKKTNRNKMLIIGGIALVVTGGIATAMYVNKKRSDNDDVIDSEVDDIMDIDEIGVDDVTGVEIDSDDTPVVTID